MREIRESRAKRAAQRVTAPAPPSTHSADPVPGATESTNNTGKQANAVERTNLPAETRSYIQRQIKEVRPLLEECVSQSAHASAEGTLQVSFVIDGEPGVGGLVRDSRILGATFPMSKELESCVAETLYSMRFEPPEGGGLVRVNYPFTLTRSKVDGPGLDEAEAQPPSPETLPGFRREAPLLDQAAGARG